MFKLAFNEEAVLIKCGREYYYIRAGFENHGCYNEQSTDYNALNALGSFVKLFGEPTWTHKHIYHL